MNAQRIIDLFLASSDKRAAEILISVIFRPLPEGRNRLELNDLVKRTIFLNQLVSDEPERIALKFSSIIQSSTETPIIRKIFIIFLYSLFTSRVMLYPTPQLKPVLLSLLQQERWMPAFATLSRIISIEISLFFTDPNFNDYWIDLLEHIDFLLVMDVKKGLWLIRDLPINMKGRFFKKIYRHMFLPVIFHHLRDTSKEDEDLWVLAFGASYTMALLLIGIEREFLISGITNEILNRVGELFSKGKQVYVGNAFKSIHYIQDKEWRNGSYSRRLVYFVNGLADRVYRFEGVTDETKNAVRRYMSPREFYRL